MAQSRAAEHTRRDRIRAIVCFVVVSLVDAHGGVERYEMEWNTHTHEFVCVCKDSENTLLESLGGLPTRGT